MQAVRRVWLEYLKAGHRPDLGWDPNQVGAVQHEVLDLGQFRDGRRKCDDLPTLGGAHADEWFEDRASVGRGLVDEHEQVLPAFVRRVLHVTMELHLVGPGLHRVTHALTAISAGPRALRADRIGEAVGPQTRFVLVVPHSETISITGASPVSQRAHSATPVRSVGGMCGYVYALIGQKPGHVHQTILSTCVASTTAELLMSTAWNRPSSRKRPYISVATISGRPPASPPR